MWFNISRIRIDILQKVIKIRVQGSTQDQDLMAFEGEEVGLAEEADLVHLGLPVKSVEKLVTLLLIVSTYLITNSLMNNQGMILPHSYQLLDQEPIFR